MANYFLSNRKSISGLISFRILDRIQLSSNNSTYLLSFEERCTSLLSNLAMMYTDFFGFRTSSTLTMLTETTSKVRFVLGFGFSLSLSVARFSTCRQIDKKWDLPLLATEFDSGSEFLDTIYWSSEPFLKLMFINPSPTENTKYGGEGFWEMYKRCILNECCSHRKLVLFSPAVLFSAHIRSGWEPLFPVVVTPFSQFSYWTTVHLTTGNPERKKIIENVCTCVTIWIWIRLVKNVRITSAISQIKSLIFTTIDYKNLQISYPEKQNFWRS